MSYCYNPLKGWAVGFNPQSKKQKIVVTGYDVDHLEWINGHWQKIYDSYVSGVRPAVMKFMQLPCGQCIGCRLQRSREWANRMMMELATTQGDSCFLTLTYDDDHLTFADGCDPVTGELARSPTLVLRHLQLFIKSLRKATKKKIRYFACGEYGDQTARPHYHLILFGFCPDDLQLQACGRKGAYNYYSSQFIAKLWNYGYNIIADVTWESCAYTARYVVKKLTGARSEVYTSLAITPPFVVMSRRPGLGQEYYMKFKDKFDDDDYRLHAIDSPSGSVQFARPRYFKKLRDRANSSDDLDLNAAFNDAYDLWFSNIADQVLERKVVEFQTDLSYIEQLKVAEYNKQRTTEILRRNLL